MEWISQYLLVTLHKKGVAWVMDITVDHFLGLRNQKTSQNMSNSECLQPYKEVKYTLVQALRLCTGRTAHWWSRGIALPLHNHGTRRGWGVSVTPQPLFTPGKDPVPIVQEAGWASGPVWTGAKNLAPHWDLIPGPCSQLLYRLSYRAHLQPFDTLKRKKVRITEMIWNKTMKKHIMQ